MATKFELYDAVRVIRLPHVVSNSSEPKFRAPRIGDIGTLVMFCEQLSEGYTVEGVAADGKTEWLSDLFPEDLEKV